MQRTQCDAMEQRIILVTSSTAAAHVLISLWLCHCVCSVCHAWGDFGLAFDWRTWVGRSCCYTACCNLFSSFFPYPAPPTPALFDCSTIRFSLKLINVNDAFKSFWWTASQCPSTASLVSLIRPHSHSLLLPPLSGTKNLCTIFVFYAIFTGCQLSVGSCKLPVAACLLVELICKPICYIVHVSQRIVYYQPTQRVAQCMEGEGGRLRYASICAAIVCAGWLKVSATIIVALKFRILRVGWEEQERETRSIWKYIRKHLKQIITFI